MSNLQRGPRPSGYAVEQPDSPGQWWFIGNVVFKGAHYAPDTVVEIDDLRPYDIVAEAKKLTITEDGSAYYGNVEWIGWWVKQKM